jgi:hypothetical protein
MFDPLVNNPGETTCIADPAADLVGEAYVDRNRSLITAAKDFAYCSRLAMGPLSILAMPVALAAAPLTTRITLSTTLHCILVQLSSRDRSRKTRHDYPATDIHCVLLVARIRIFLPPDKIPIALIR